MTGLLADGWFYISSGGLLVSGVLFFFLLGQYRAAGDAADQLEAEAEPHVPFVRPLSNQDEPISSIKIASVPAEKPASAEPMRDAAPAPAEKRSETATSAVNPAVVYLQNIKNELQELHQETRELAKRVNEITGRDEALIERLSELAQAVAELKGSSPAVAESPAPKRSRKSEPSPAVVKEEAPAEAPAAAPAAEPPIATVEAPAVAAAPETKEEPKTEPEPKAEALITPAELFSPAAKVSEEPEAEERPRRGPVWPV